MKKEDESKLVGPTKDKNINGNKKKQTKMIPGQKIDTMHVS